MNPGRKLWRLGWRLAIAGVLLAWIFHVIFVQETRAAWLRDGAAWQDLTRAQQWRQAWQTGPGALWRTLTVVDPGALLASFGLMGLTILIGVLRWRMILGVQGLQLAFHRAAEISLVAHFFNSFLLGSTGGDLLKAYYAARETHHRKTEAVTTVIVDRLIGLLAMLIFGTLMMLLNYSLLLAHDRLRAVSGLILLMLAGCSLVALLAFWGGVSRQWPNARVWFRKLPKGELLDRSLNACRRFGQEHWLLLKALFVSMVLNVVCVLQVLVLARGLDLTIAPRALFFIVPAIICISALPITPSGLGVRENLYVWTLSAPQLGVDATKALSLSLLAYAGSLLWSVAGGLVYVTFRASHHLAEIAETPASTDET